MLKLADLNDQQRSDREAVVETLERAGWEERSTSRSSIRGSIEFQASLEYDGNRRDVAHGPVRRGGAGAGAQPRGAARRGRALDLAGGKLQQLLDLIVSFQDEISSENFREYVDKILDVVPEVFVDRGEDGMQPLVKDDGTSL